MRTPPLILDRAQGSYVYDITGRRYLDGVASIWVNVHGHRHPDLDRALIRQLRKAAHTTLLGAANPPSIQLARALVRVAPKGLTRVFYSDDGSTAVEVALKMALQYWQQRRPSSGSKRVFVRFTQAYHGDTAGAMSIGGINLFHDRFRGLRVPTLAVESPYCYRCPIQRTYPDCGIACLDPLEALLQERHREIAAVVVEPGMQAAAGMIAEPPGHLSRVRALCTRYNVLMIADEVATGFGRTGRMFACGHEGVTPDLMAVSKGLTGGYLPLGATLATEQIFAAFLGRYDQFKTFFHGHSYTGNPLGCAVALSNLTVFRKEHTLARVRRRAGQLTRLLRPLNRLAHVGEVRQHGLMVGIELVKRRDTKTPYPLTEQIGNRIAAVARRRGLLLRPLGAVIVLLPPLAVSERELARMVAIIRLSIRQVTESVPRRRKPAP
ncbi:adenosylmethionine-8-amino-7-oxononanoate aminotransferase [Nitrospira sp.]|nr:adenosylmethionine-8-amino-7-oxononanoate aminotransferase [Nitrospira sp.]